MKKLLLLLLCVPLIGFGQKWEKQSLTVEDLRSLCSENKSISSLDFRYSIVPPSIDGELSVNRFCV